jgi:hypothetical protein
MTRFARSDARRRAAVIAGAERASSPPTSSSPADEKRVGSFRLHCSLRSLRLAPVSRCLPHSLRSLVQDSGAPAWLSTAARDPCHLAPLKAWEPMAESTACDYGRIRWLRVPASAAPAGRRARTMASVPTPEDRPGR